jgi:hypothetical protein
MAESEKGGVKGGKVALSQAEELVVGGSGRSILEGGERERRIGKRRQRSIEQRIPVVPVGGSGGKDEIRKSKEPKRGRKGCFDPFRIWGVALIGVTNGRGARVCQSMSYQS